MLAHLPIVTHGVPGDAMVFLPMPPPPVKVEPPTLFHVTHAKAGSQWIHRLFHMIDYDRLVLPHDDRRQFLQSPIIPGKIYPTLFINKSDFDSVPKPENSRVFVVIRDLRDTMVSLCYSLLVSHRPEDGSPGQIDAFRSNYGMQQFDEALMYLIRNWAPSYGELQMSWIDQGYRVFRYHELLQNDLTCFREIFNEIGQLQIPEAKLQDLVIQNRFSALSGGRQQGNEDVNNHYRKGMCGDWIEKFTSQHVHEFKNLLNHYLVATGFEKDRNW